MLKAVYHMCYTLKTHSLCHMDVCVREWGLVGGWVCSCTCMHVHVWVHTCGEQARDEEEKATVARVHGVAMLCYTPYIWP